MTLKHVLRNSVMGLACFAAVACTRGENNEVNVVQNSLRNLNVLEDIGNLFTAVDVYLDLRRQTRDRSFPDVRTLVTREQIAATGARNVTFVQFELTSYNTFFELEAVVGDVTVLADAADQSTFAFRDGVLFETRGFGDDIIQADMFEVPPNLARGAGTHSREYTYLGGDADIESIVFECEVSTRPQEQITIMGLRYTTQPIIETCELNDYVFQNEYWRDLRTGVFVRSAQWVSPVIERIVFEVIN